MKTILMTLIFLFSSFWARGLSLSSGPIDLFIYSFCLKTDKCEFFIKIENKTSYSIGLNTNQITEAGVDSSSIVVFDAEKYSLLEENSKDVYQALIPLKTAIPRQHKNIQKQEYVLQLEPYSKVEFKIKNVDELYKLDEGKLYIAKIFLPVVDIFINGEYVGFKTLKSNFSEFEKLESPVLEDKKK